MHKNQVNNSVKKAVQGGRQNLNKSLNHIYQGRLSYVKETRYEASDDRNVVIGKPGPTFLGSSICKRAIYSNS